MTDKVIKSKFKQMQNHIDGIEKELRYLNIWLDVLNSSKYRFRNLTDFFNPPFDIESIMVNPADNKEEIFDRLFQKIEDIKFSNRIVYVIKSVGCIYLGELIIYGKDLLLFRKIGDKSLKEIETELEKLGLKFPKYSIRNK